MISKWIWNTKDASYCMDGEDWQNHSLNLFNFHKNKRALGIRLFTKVFLSLFMVGKKLFYSFPVEDFNSLS